MPEGISADILGQACLTYGNLDGFVDDAGINVMAARQAGTRVDRKVTGRKHVLPSPLFARLRILVGERVRQINVPMSLSQILLVEGFDFGQVILKERMASIIRKPLP